MEKKTIIDLFESSAKRFPSNPFLWEKTGKRFEPTTYAEVRDLVYEEGAGLISLGVRKGDNMALLSEGRNAWIIGELAMFYAGATNVPLSIKLEEANDLLFRLVHADVKYIMVSGQQLKKIRAIKDKLPAVRKIIVLDEQAEYQDREMPLSEIRRMEPEKLEKIILDFVNYEYDVLIATSIVESGIDVPNANTIIINNAQQFGLSDLHQLRGRVGRSNRKAFCYLLSPPLTSLTQEARRRLQAIENFSELGSGIHIAMQDLDIRGAGNMLGAEQSGFIADLGYETYQKILEEAVDELKSEEFADLYADNTEGHRDTGSEYVRETYIESDLELMFPPTYIPNDSERISLYRELDNMEEERDILAFTERLKDRFGKIPKEGKELIRIVRLRRMAKKLGMEKVVLKKGQMSLFLVNNPDSPYYQSEAFGKLLGFIQKHPRECNLREQNGKRSIVIKNVPTVEAACGYLQEMEKINSTNF